MDDTSATGIAPGQPRSAVDAAALERFEAIIRMPLILSAILPLIVVPQEGKPVSVVVGIVSWLVFVVDYVVTSRHLEKYHRTGFGRFDLVVVVVTAPWFLLPGAQAGGFVVVLRLARLARVLMVSRRARRLLATLGRVGAVAAGIVVVAALVAYHAEHATNPGFATIGDAMWWGVVTFTTVGYGDIVPHTSIGRWAGVVIMFTGIAVLGVLAGSMATFFRLTPSEAASAAADEPTADGTPPQAPSPDTFQGLTAEVTALRTQVESLTNLLSPPASSDG